MINEDKKSRGQEGKQISSLHTLAPCGRGQGEGLYGLPRPHFVRPRNDETTCHAERRIDLCVSCHAELVSASHGNKIPEPLQEDPFCTKSADFGKRRQVRDDIRNRHCEAGFSGGRRVSVANPARKVAFGRYSDATPNNPIEHSEDVAIQRETVPTSILTTTFHFGKQGHKAHFVAPVPFAPHKGGSTTPSLEGRLGWVPIRGAVAKSSEKVTFTLAEVFLSHFAGRRKIAFTLAEVLITLGIVGIVAAMTLPALITKHQQQATISALKKNYSLLTNAINRAKSIYGDDLFGWSAFPDYYNNQKTINHIELLNILKNSGVNIIEITNKYQAQYTVVSFCGVEKYTKTNGGALDVGAGGTGIAWGMLPDGACWAVSGTKYPNTSEIALDSFSIDINGAKKPNKMGRDLFVFTIKRNGQVIPYESSRGVWAQCSSYWQCSGQACAEKIMRDGWQIKKGYPW